MQKLILEVEFFDNFQIGLCKECDFHRGSDQCDLINLLTRGKSNSNSFCPLKLKLQNGDDYNNDII